MSEKIGTAAGKVWHYLKQNGAATASAISKGIGEDTATTHQAIGWLAREDKLIVDRSSRNVRYALKE